MIKVDNIIKSFGADEVLKGISATFEKGKTNLIIGRSGSGKTVMLKCMIGLFTTNSGEIFFEDQAISKMDIGAQRTLREDIGMLFQGGALFDSMNIEDNVMFPLRMFSNDKRPEMLKRVNEVLKRVDLENVNHKFPSEISGGMKKRVSIARAIVNNPKYLFCDEPNSGLDPKTATVIDQLIQEITKENNITTVVVTHDMNSVMEIGEKIVFLKNGTLVWQGSNQEIFKTDNEDLTGTENFGGTTVTRGGITITSGTLDKKIHFHDSKNGELLKSILLPYIGSAPPSTYSINGEQFIVVHATGGWTLRGGYGDLVQTGDAIVGFKLKK